MLGLKMGLEILPAFTAHPSKADGEQVSESRGPWGHPPTCTEWEGAWAPLPGPGDLQSPGCHKDSVAGGYLTLRQLLVGHRCLWEESTQNSTQPEVSPGTQSSTWHPGYQCHPLNSSCLPFFAAWNPCWVALCYGEQLPHPHPGCVGSTGQCPYVYPPTLAPWAQGWALPAQLTPGHYLSPGL